MMVMAARRRAISPSSSRSSQTVFMGGLHVLTRACAPGEKGPRRTLVTYYWLYAQPGSARDRFGRRIFSRPVTWLYARRRERKRGVVWSRGPGRVDKRGRRSIKKKKEQKQT